jgi:hypothetical protein
VARELFVLRSDGEGRFATIAVFVLVARVTGDAPVHAESFVKKELMTKSDLFVGLGVLF